MKPFVLFLNYLKQRNIIKRTWHIEALFVLILLITTALISQKGMIEYIGIAAVFFTFLHASVAERLSEVQEVKDKSNQIVEVHCYHKLKKYFYIKEILWLIYFSFLGAWSAIVGVVIFLLYPLWRRAWRKHCI